MHFYRYQNKLLFSFEEYSCLEKISVSTVDLSKDNLYFLKNFDRGKSRRSFVVTQPSQLFIKEEGINLLALEESQRNLPPWLIDRIHNREVVSINTAYDDWQDVLNLSPPPKWRVNILGLGDVGSNLLIGLKLLGGDCIKEIGIYDRNPNKLQRWEREANQIYGVNQPMAKVVPLDFNNLFNCDLFIFCVAARVPAIGEENIDVRMVQLKENAKILSTYGKMARDVGYKGIFAVVSDPVDLLCSSLLKASNTDTDGNMDYKGLLPDQIRGYGLGVMNARALYYAMDHSTAPYYETEGRAYGPHGEGLIIADNIHNYNHEKSLYLTEKAKTANLEIRSLGFKPYIAPALSSGALSILDTIRGNWHYSATYMGGVYMGALNRFTSQGVEVEANHLHPQLLERLKGTYQLLEELGKGSE
ncbi:lactate/malate family dehydrogenase [Alkaliphilus serpentinus]|uniref:Lactate dehydrogenase n=1 Tax=Alkaliphilus serpentinus TaxID=1482731 RepID=A0A833HPE2_9FIRM|nr:lactate dehydrogenase [Alkaliphilus serpentinus]KAB3530554.1 lactate dehydrogenase [Alkaliphilus serpentinus]